MKRFISALTAAVMALTGTATTVQAGYMPRLVTPAFSDTAIAAGVEQVSSRKWRYRGNRWSRHHSRYRTGYASRYGHHRYYGYRGYGASRNYSYYRHHRYHQHHDHGNAALAAGIIGLAFGAIIAGQAYGGRNHANCAARFRSYNPSTGTYLGFDGYRHFCR